MYRDYIGEPRGMTVCHIYQIITHRVLRLLGQRRRLIGIHNPRIFAVFYTIELRFCRRQKKYLQGEI